MPKVTKVADASVRQFDDVNSGGGFAHYIISLASYADGFPKWGENWRERDQMLREFYKTEPWLNAAIASITARNAAFSWTLEGPPRTVKMIQDILHQSEFGKGWQHLIQKLSTDLYTQDNGAFMEIIRQGETEESPLVGLGHLDAGRITRTGDPEIPYIYIDRENNEHRLAYWQCVDFTDNPSPDEMKNGLQVCGVSRALAYSQLLRDISIRNREKVSGRNPAALHIVSGMSTDQLEAALASAAAHSDAKGRMRYQPPVVCGTLDPTAEVSATKIELASLPEGWDESQAYQWYIAVLALALGCEYQDLAPLPGGNLGTSQQSTILHLKARGKGPEMFQKMIEHKLNFFVLPQNVTFKFEERDFSTEGIEADVDAKRATVYSTYITMGMPKQVVYQIMQDDGSITPEIYELLKEAEVEDATPEQIATDEAQYQEVPPGIQPIPADQPVVQPQPAGEGKANPDQIVSDQASPNKKKEAKICPECGKRLKEGAGAKAIYCSDACKQLAYRKRKALAPAHTWEDTEEVRARLEHCYYQQLAGLFGDMGQAVEDRLMDFEEQELENAEE